MTGARDILLETQVSFFFFSILEHALTISKNDEGHITRTWVPNMLETWVVQVVSPTHHRCTPSQVQQTILFLKVTSTTTTVRLNVQNWQFLLARTLTRRRILAKAITRKVEAKLRLTSECTVGYGMFWKYQAAVYIYPQSAVKVTRKLTWNSFTQIYFKSTVTRDDETMGVSRYYTVYTGRSGLQVRWMVLTVTVATNESASWTCMNFVWTCQWMHPHHL